MAGRIGIIRTLLFEVSAASDEAAEAIHFVAARGLATVVRYLVDQMAAGRLRTMHPLLAVQVLRLLAIGADL